MLDVQGCVMGWVDSYFDVPPSARFCLGQWEFGRTGWAGGQDDGTSKSTQLREATTSHLVDVLNFQTLF